MTTSRYIPLDIWNIIVKQNENDECKSEIAQFKIELLKTVWNNQDIDNILYNQYDISEIKTILSDPTEDVEDYINQTKWYVYGRNRFQKDMYVKPNISSTIDDTIYHLVCPETNNEMYLRILPKTDVNNIYDQRDLIYTGFVIEEPFCGYYIYETIMRP